MAVTDDCHRYWLRDTVDNAARRGYKNVFREMDGFLVLMSVLSTIRDKHTHGDHTTAIETTRPVFVVLADATTYQPENSDFLRVCTLMSLCN